MWSPPSSVDWRHLATTWVAMARNVLAASRHLPSGIALRVADYENVSALTRALTGIDDMVFEFTITRRLCIMHYGYRSYLVVATW
jgi:hypothetical protein